MTDYLGALLSFFVLSARRGPEEFRMTGGMAAVSPQVIQKANAINERKAVGNSHREWELMRCALRP